jgi:hypothetical protein
MTEEKAQARTSQRDGEATDASPSDNGTKPATDENAGISHVWEDSMNGHADKTSKEEKN